MLFSTAILTAILPVLALARSTSSDFKLEKRAAMCGQWDTQTIANGQYIVYNNLWGQGQATSGSQCTTVGTVSGNNVAWTTKFSWTGGAGQVKSYANVAVLKNLDVALSSVKSIPSTWNWKWTSPSSNLIADVSYDLWLGPQKDATNTVELMVWLSAKGGAGPASNTGKPLGTYTIAGHKWTLYQGTVSTWQVYSYVTAEGDITAFTADLKLFFNDLVANHGVSNSLLVTDVQAGTEPFSGSATLTTSKYSAVVNV